MLELCKVDTYFNKAQPKSHQTVTVLYVSIK